MDAARRKECLALGALVAVGAALRFWNLGLESCWHDESWTWGLIRGTPKDLVLRLSKFDAHPPLYFLLAQAWTLLGSSDAWLRALSVLFGLAAIPLLHRLAARMGGPRAGLFAAAALTLSPYHVYYSREARSYALLVLLCVVSLDLLFDLVLAPDRKKWAAFAAVSAAILLTHYMGCFFLAAEAIAVLILRRERPGILREFALAALGAMILYLPWLPVFIRHVTAVNAGFWLPAPTASVIGFSLCSLIVSPFFMGSLGYWLAGAFFGLAAVGVRGRKELGLLLLAVFPPLGELLVSLHRPLFYAQTFQYILLPVFVLAAVAVARLPGLRGAALAAAACAAMLPGLYRTESQLAKEDWRGAVAWMGTSVAADEVVVVHPGFLGVGLERYAAAAPWMDRVRLVDAGDMTLEPLPRAAIRSELGTKGGLWLIFRHGGDDGWFADLEKDFSRKESFKERGVEVHHLRRK